MPDNPFAFALLRPGVWGVAVGDRAVGRVRGDYAAGFEAVLLDGTVLPGVFTDPEPAAEVLALEASLRAL